MFCTRCWRSRMLIESQSRGSVLLGCGAQERFFFWSCDGLLFQNDRRWCSEMPGFHVPLFGKTVRKDGLSLQYVGFSMRCFPHGKRLWYQDTGGRLLIETASTLTFTAHLSPHQRFLLNSYHVFLSSADSIVEFLPFVFWMQIQMCQSLACLGRVLRFAIVICIYNRINNHMAGIIRMLFAKQGLYCFVAIRQLCAVMFLFNHSLGFLSVWPFWKRWQLVLVNYMLLCGSK